MGTDLDIAYEGREHSGIKHALLKAYLEKLLLIKGMKDTQNFTYVDCFAGPWDDESDDFHATSIAISLGILKKVRDALAAQGKYTSMKAIYIEKSKASFSQLESYLKSSSPSGIQSIPIHGDYADKTDEILRHCQGSFTFFFVDPKQWTPISIPKLLPLLARDNSEFVINFMYDFFQRALPQHNEKLRVSIRSLLGTITDEEISGICSLNPDAKEQAIVRKYRESLKANMPKQPKRMPRSYHATILDKDKEKTKYHLVYLTCHSKGVVEFARLSEGVAIIQRKVRFDAKQAKTGIADMFGIDDATIMQLEAADIEDVKRYWMNTLGIAERVYTEDDLADMLEDTDWLISDFERAFMALQTEGKAENLDADRKRPVHPVNFKNGERLRRCV